jgi:hypothetical protein
MEPKQKAKELRNKFYNNNSSQMDDMVRFFYSFKMANIAADEVIDTLKNSGIVGSTEIDYWEQVKKHLEFMIPLIIH